MDNQVFLDEPIQVVAVFRNSRTLCEPVKFRRPSGQVVNITEIGLRHPTTKGQRTVHVFDVTDGQSDYRLEFDSQQLLWRLTIASGA